MQDKPQAAYRCPNTEKHAKVCKLLLPSVARGCELLCLQAEILTYISILLAFKSAVYICLQRCAICILFFLPTNAVLVFCFLHKHKTPGLYFNCKCLNKHKISFLYRYAMTVWYFDAEERAEAKKKFRNLTGMILL